MVSATIFRWELDYVGLPRVCMCCGSQAQHFPRICFRSIPYWPLVLCVANPLVGAIIIGALARSMRVSTPLCQQHRNYWRIRFALVYYELLFVVIVSMVLFGVSIGLSGDPDRIVAACLYSAILGLRWFASAAFVHMTSIAVGRIRNDHITLVRLHRDFADALRLQRRGPPRET
jgi:hypothetical protein